MLPATTRSARAVTIHEFPDYESLSRQAAEDILALIVDNPKASICLATGSTPTRTYEFFAKSAQGKARELENIRFIKLDEWGGLAEEHPSTCEHYLRKHIMQPLQVSPDRFISFKPDAQPPDSECARIQAELDRLSCIDLCVLGLGANGHLGFNEPAESLQPYVHVAQLAAKTQEHPMLDGSAVVPEYGMTLGMANILSAKKIMLLVNGQHKVPQLRRLLMQKVESAFPASFLWLHANVHIYSDVRI